jgi:hypothetical protein
MKTKILIVTILFLSIIKMGAQEFKTAETKDIKRISPEFGNLRKIP